MSKKNLMFQIYFEVTSKTLLKITLNTCNATIECNNQFCNKSNQAKAIDLIYRVSLCTHINLKLYCIQISIRLTSCNSFRVEQ